MTLDSEISFCVTGNICISIMLSKCQERREVISQQKTITLSNIYCQKRLGVNLNLITNMKVEIIHVLVINSEFLMP